MILWKRIDMPGHELAELREHDHGWRLTGIAVLAQNGRPCRLDYDIECDAAWRTQVARIRANLDGRGIALEISRDSRGEWSLNGIRLPALSGCMNVDLGFSPSTNLLPIRRLQLAVGGQARVRAAWVRFPELTMEVLDQTYTRLSATTYRYESADGAFQRELTVNANGFVTDYPGLWLAEARSSKT